VTVHQRLNGRAPPYLSEHEHCIPVSSADTRRHLRSASRHLLAVSRFRLNTYHTIPYHAIPYSFTAVGCSQLLARWPGTHSWILSGIQRAAQTVLGIYLKRTCSRITCASSALRVLNDYALCKSTHSLTHLTLMVLYTNMDAQCDKLAMVVRRIKLRRRTFFSVQSTGQSCRWQYCFWSRYLNSLPTHCRISPGQLLCQNELDLFRRFNTIPASGRQTERQKTGP